MQEARIRRQPEWLVIELIEGQVHYESPFHGAPQEPRAIEPHGFDKRFDPFMFTQSSPPKRRTGRAATGSLYGGGSSGGLYGSAHFGP